EPMRFATMATPLLLGTAMLLGCSETPEGPSGNQRVPSLAADLGLAGDVLAGQLIAFASDRDGTGFQVFLMQANGSKLKQLTSVPGYNRSEEHTSELQSLRHIV